MRDPLPVKTQVCPKCHSAKIGLTRRRGIFEKLLVFLGGKLRRCEECRVRFVHFRPSPADSVVKTEVCPKCRSSRVWRTRRSDNLEWLLVFLRGNLRRCEMCDARFAHWGSHGLLLSTKLRNATQWTVAAMSLLLGAWLLMQGE